MSEYLDFEGLEHYHTLSNEKQLDSAQIISEAINNLGTTLSQSSSGKTDWENIENKPTKLSDFIADSLRTSNNEDIITIKDKKVLYKLKEVATLDDIPEQVPIPEQVQANWNETNVNSKAYIQNKPELKNIEVVTDNNGTYLEEKDSSGLPMSVHSLVTNTTPNSSTSSYVAPSWAKVEELISNTSGDSHLSSSDEKVTLTATDNGRQDIDIIADQNLNLIAGEGYLNHERILTEKDFKGISQDENENLWLTKTNGQKNPVSHPNLSTQPSILPQRFGTYLMYELLIPYVIEDRGANQSIAYFDTSVVPKNAVIIEGSVFNETHCEPINWTKGIDSVNINSNSGGILIQKNSDFIPDFALIRYYISGASGGYTYYQESNKEYLYWRLIKNSLYALVDKDGKRINYQNSGYFFNNAGDLYSMGWSSEYPTNWEDSTGITESIDHPDSAVYVIKLKGGETYTINIETDTITPTANNYIEKTAFWKYAGAGVYLMCDKNSNVLTDNSNNVFLKYPESGYKEHSGIEFGPTSEFTYSTTKNISPYSPVQGVYIFTVDETEYTVDLNNQTVTPAIQSIS